VSDRRIHSNALIVTEDLTNKIVAWATRQLVTRRGSRRERRAMTTCASVVASGGQAEGATLRDAEIVADACVDAARRIMTELLALRAGVPQGRA
jgi:hypothetical protein